MLVSMTPNDEVKTIHASLNDGSLRKWEFEPYTEQGKIELMDQDYATIRSIKGNTVKFNQLVQNDNYTNSQTDTRTNLQFIAQRTSPSQIDLFIVRLTTTGIYKRIVQVPTGGSGNYTFKHNGASLDLIFFQLYLNENHKYLISFDFLGINPTTVGGLSYKNAMLFDLTAMGIDNLTTVEQVEDWLSNNIGLLPYYDYTLGSLISFNGTGIKTENASQTESNTLSLPISTLFPTGMKEAGSVYDEISDKAYTRVKRIKVEQLGVGSNRQNGDFYVPIIGTTDAKPVSNNDTVGNAICNVCDNVSATAKYIGTTSQISVRAVGYIDICIAGITTKADLETYISTHDIYIEYELATPTEQDISIDLTYPVYKDGTEQILPVNGSTPTTSPMVATIEYPDRTEEANFLYKQTTFESAIPQFSLVCKNQELPMALEDGKLICECDSSITNESGFFDCKVKMQDLNSVAYSQKIQLHVERGIND